jgi:hypothetical protein
VAIATAAATRRARSGDTFALESRRLPATTCSGHGLRQGTSQTLTFLIGTWGDETVHDRKLVSWVFNPAAEAFMAVDSAGRPAARSLLCAQTLTRDQVITDSSLMALTTELIDAVWLGDPRVQEVKELANDAYQSLEASVRVGGAAAGAVREYAPAAPIEGSWPAPRLLRGLSRCSSVSRRRRTKEHPCLGR